MLLSQNGSHRNAVIADPVVALSCCTLAPWRLIVKAPGLNGPEEPTSDEICSYLLLVYIS